MSRRNAHRRHRETPDVSFPTSSPWPGADDAFEAVEPADVSGEAGPESLPPSAPPPQNACPPGYCPRCWEAGAAQVLDPSVDDHDGPGTLLRCHACAFFSRSPFAVQEPPPPAFQTLLLPHRAPGVDPLLHVAFWAGRPHEVLAIASPETVSCGALALPPGARVFFLRELP